MGKTKKRSRKCPAYSRLPDTTLYLRRGERLLRKRRYKQKKTASLKFPMKESGGNETFQDVRERLVGDNAPLRNMITFVTVQGLDKYQDKIMFDLRNVNFIDTEVYPKVKRMEQELVRMMGDLFNDEDHMNCRGISTIGSSEAIYVGTLLHKFKWEERNRKQATHKLNAIYSFNTHVNWDKATRWNYIEQRKVLPIANRPDSYVFGAKEVGERINASTICVACTLATTRTGQNDKIREINDFLVKYHKKTGIFVPIHVDAAIGGFITPFVQPNLLWDFRLPHVKSINVSFHKYGGVYAGMGMCVVKSDYSLPDKFRFSFNVEKTASSLSKSLTVKSTNFAADPHAAAPTANANDRRLVAETKRKSNVARREGIGGEFSGALDDWYVNFTKPSSQIVTAYYLVKRLGYIGYKKRMENTLELSGFVSKYINGIRSYDDDKRLVFKQINEPYYPEIAFKLEDYKFPLRDVLSRLERKNGYSVAAYKMDPSTPDIVFRLVIKPNFTMAEAKTFVHELDESVKRGKKLHSSNKKRRSIKKRKKKKSRKKSKTIKRHRRGRSSVS